MAKKTSDDILREVDADEKELDMAMKAKEQLAKQKRKDEEHKLKIIKQAKDDKLIPQEDAQKQANQVIGGTTPVAQPKPISISTDEPSKDDDTLDSIKEEKIPKEPKPKLEPDEVPSASKLEVKPIQPEQPPKPAPIEEPTPATTPGAVDIKLEKAEAPKPEEKPEEPEEISEEQLQSDINSLKEDAADMEGQDLHYLQGLYARTQEMLDIGDLGDEHKSELTEILNNLERKIDGEGDEKAEDQKAETPKPEVKSSQKEEAEPEERQVFGESYVNSLSFKDGNWFTKEGIQVIVISGKGDIECLIEMDPDIGASNKKLYPVDEVTMNYAVGVMSRDIRNYEKLLGEIEEAKEEPKAKDMKTETKEKKSDFKADALAEQRAKRRLLHRDYQKVKAQKKIETQKAKPGEEYLPEELDDVLDSFKRAKAGEGESGIYLAKALTGLYDMQEKSTSFKQKREIKGYMWRLGRIAKIKKLQNLTDQQLEDVLDANKVHPAVQYEMIDIYRTAVNTKSKYAEPKKPGAQEEE